MVLQKTFRRLTLQSLSPNIRLEPAVPYALAVGVGITSGVAAVFFRELIALFDDVFYGRLADVIGYVGTLPAILIPAAGGLIVGPLIYFGAREAKGHGVPEVMLAVEREGGRIRPRVAAVKALASAVTIGSGGSVGREGPIVQVSSALASTIGQAARLPDDSIRLLVASGAAGGIAATFNAPIAGAFFALEVILRHFNVRNFSLIVLTSVVAAAIAHIRFGDNPAFTIPNYELESGSELILYALLGALAAVVAVAFIKVLYGCEDLFDRVPIPEWSKASIGGLGVGLLGLWYVELLGVGYGGGPGRFAIPAALDGSRTLETLAILALLKVVATSVTVGSGGSGGVFAPSLFIGAMLGGAFGNFLGPLWPDAAGPSGSYAIVGMAAVFAGAARAPMTAILILFEMTRDYSMILPLMTGVVVASALARAITSDNIYSLKLRRRGILLREAREGPILSELPVGEAMQTSFVSVAADDRLAALLNGPLRNGALESAVLVQEGGVLLGVLTAGDVGRAVESGQNLEDLTAGDVATRHPVTVYPDQSLDEAVRRMSAGSLRQLPVVARGNSRPIGIIRRSDIFGAYSRHSHRPAHGRLSMLAGLEAYGTSIVDLLVPPDSGFIGKCLGDLNLPEDSVVASIVRNGSVVFPKQNTRLAANDCLLVITTPGKRSGVLGSLGLVDQPAEGTTNAP